MGLFATCVYLWGNLPVRLATQRKSLRKFNLPLLATTCESVWPRLNPSRKRSFSEKLRLQTGGTWKRRHCLLVWRENILKIELFENDCVTIITWSPWPSVPQKLIQNDRRSSRRSVDWKHLMRFQSETSVFNFLRCSGLKRLHPLERGMNLSWRYFPVYRCMLSREG